MLYRVIKGALDSEFIARIEEIVAELPILKGTTLDLVTNTPGGQTTRECDVRWIRYGAPGFTFAVDRIVSALREAGTEGSEDWEIEDLQYTAYGPGAFHDWHIDAYRRSYNRYDLRLGERFIGKKRKLSLSVLLNSAQCFTGGSFEISMFPNRENTVGTALETFSEPGDMAVFDSSLIHRVAPVCTGLRKSLVVWICA
jgi:hypothetical protein